MDENVAAAAAVLKVLPSCNRPGSTSKLASLLQRRGCCAVHVYKLVTPQDLAQALVPLLENTPALQAMVKPFAESTEEKDLDENKELANSQFVQLAAQRTALRLRSATNKFSSQTLHAQGLWLASQAFGVLVVQPEKLVGELVKQGMVIEASGRLTYDEERIPSKKVDAAVRTETFAERAAEQDATDIVPTPKQSEPWDWSFWRAAKVRACSDPDSSQACFKLTGCAFPGSFFGNGGTTVIALRQKLRTIHCEMQIVELEGAMKITYKGEPPAIGPLNELVMLLAGKTPPICCKRPCRRGRVKGFQISEMSDRHKVRLHRVGEVLQVWPTAPQLPAKLSKADLASDVTFLRNSLEAAKVAVDADLAKIFDALAEGNGNYEDYQYRHDRRAHQSEHCQKVGPGHAHRLLGAQYQVQKEGHADHRELERLKKEQHKAHLASRDERKKRGNRGWRQDRDKKPTQKGGRHKAAEDATDAGPMPAPANATAPPEEADETTARANSTLGDYVSSSALPPTDEM